MSLSDDDGSFDGDDDTFLADFEDEMDYYALLNVPRDATDDEITKAYKNRCLIFHPDRHLDENDKKEASKIFVKLHQAYETLSNPQSRSVYDAVGLRGLQIDGWQLVQRSTNPENIRKEYELLKRLRETEIMLHRVNPMSSLAFKVSLIESFAKNSKVLGMSISQEVNCPLTSTDKVGLGGAVKTVNGRGDCSIVASYRKSLGGSLHMDNSLTITEDLLSFATKFSRSIGQRAILIFKPAIVYIPLYEHFTGSFLLSYTMQLQSNWQGSLTFNYAPQISSLVTSIVKTELNQPKFVTYLTLSPTNSNVRLVYHWRYPELHDQHYESACTLGFNGFSTSFFGERRLSRFSKIGASLHLAFPQCLLHAKFRLKTSLSNFEVQFTLCDNEEEIGRSIAYGVLLPLLVTQLGRWLFRRPLARFMRLFEDKSDDEQINECRREEAQRIVRLMHDSAEKIRRDEERKNGLVIVEAHYGQMADGGPGAENYLMVGERLIDVTVPMQILVNDSQLRIFSTKDQLPGFYDPCPGQQKILKVVYKFRGELHSVTVNDDQALNIPMRAHLIQA